MVFVGIDEPVHFTAGIEGEKADNAVKIDGIVRPAAKGVIACKQTHIQRLPIHIQYDAAGYVHLQAPFVRKLRLQLFQHAGGIDPRPLYRVLFVESAGDTPAAAALGNQVIVSAGWTEIFPCEPAFVHDDCGIPFRHLRVGVEFNQHGILRPTDGERTGVSFRFPLPVLDEREHDHHGKQQNHEGKQDNDLTYYAGPDYILGKTTQNTKNIWKGWSPQLQVNYMVNEKHSFGAYYKYDRHPSGELTSNFFTDSYENGKFKEHSESHIWQDDNFRKHIFNAYYNGKVGKLGIDLNIDGLFDKTETPGSTTEQTTAASVTGGLPASTESRLIESNTNSSNDFWASKLIFSYPILKGNLSVGGEYSYNHRMDAYSFTSTDAVPVKATDTEINEKSAAVFVEYGRQFGRLFAQVGMRYEHLQNDYYNFGVREDDVCRNYGDWFPTVVLSAPIGKMQLSLSYRRDIERPSYSNLTSSTIYLNRYAYQSGNPYLKPTYTHSLVLNAAYQWANLTINYGRIKDVVTLSTEPFPGSTDPLISLVRPINSTEDYDQLSFSLSARPTIGKWHPTWYAYSIFQNYKTPTIDGTLKTLNHPYLTLAWNNDIELPHAFRLMANMQWSSKGDYNNNRITCQRFNTTLGVQRDFRLGRMGSLTADLRCYDVFNTDKTDAIIYGIRELTTSNPARRTFMLDLTWKFNEARSKYRGSGAGEKQKARM